MSDFHISRRPKLSEKPPKLCPVCLNDCRKVGKVWVCPKHGAVTEP